MGVSAMTRVADTAIPMGIGDLAKPLAELCSRMLLKSSKGRVSAHK